MFLLFKKIRLYLLGQGKVKRYLLYAAGEIILVVVGILIALQVNNLNELRKEKGLEKRYYLSLLQDLKKDSLDAEKKIRVAENSISSQ